MAVRPALIAMATVFFVVLFASGASATPEPKPGVVEPPKTAHEQALRLFEQSRVQYRDGHFQEAVKLLLEARSREPAPVLLYNLGRAYEGLGDRSRAIDAYSAFLTEEPSAPDRGAIEERIRTL